MIEKKSISVADAGRLGGLKGGKSTTPAKKKAAKENGKRGGRPKVPCKYCAEGPIIVTTYDKKEAALLAEHFKHKTL